MPDLSNRPIGNIEAHFVHPGNLKSDEVRLFAAHCAVAIQGHPNEFPITIKTLLSAPLIPTDGGKSRVVTMEIDTVGMLLVHGKDELVRKLMITGLDEDGEPTYYGFYEYRDHSKFGNPGYVATENDAHLAFEHHPDYIRNLVVGYAQKAFTSGVSAIVGTGGLEQKIESLRKRIRADVDAAFDNIFYAASKGAGHYVCRTNPPRLVMEESRQDREIYLKVSGKSFDPMASWVNGLISFPADLPKSASTIREAVLSVEYGTNWMNMGYVSWDDQVMGKNGNAAISDLGIFESARPAEFAIFANAVSNMAEAIIESRAGFGKETLDICAWFSYDEARGRRYLDDMTSGDWDENLAHLTAALAEDQVGFTAFLTTEGWPLKASPLAVINAKFNKLLDRDMLYGLVADKQQPKRAPGV
jgi:hypothetical protein